MQTKLLIGGNFYKKIGSLKRSNKEQNEVTSIKVSLYITLISMDDARLLLYFQISNLHCDAKSHT